MTKKDFFIVIIKLFGLASIITSLFSTIPNNISFALMDIDLFSLFWIFIAVIVLFGLFILLVFKADKVVELLKLDRGFDDNRIELGNLNSADVVKLGSFIIGGLLIINNIPTFLSHTLFAFKGGVEIMGMSYDLNNKFYWMVSGLNIILGYLLVTRYSSIAKLLQTKNEGEMNPDE